MKSKYKTILGMLLLVVAIAFFIFWEFFGRKELLSKDVIVLNENITKGQCITEKIISVKKIPVDDIIENAITDKSEIIGLEAKHSIPKDMQLVRNFFDSPALVLDKNEKIMRIPQEWLYAYPETIRRKDKIHIYAIKIDNDNQNKSDNNESSTSSSEQITDEQFLFDTTIAYVKDNANREVESLDDDRLTGTSTIGEIEIIVSENNLETLQKKIKQGYKLIIMYQ